MSRDREKKRLEATRKHYETFSLCHTDFSKEELGIVKALPDLSGKTVIDVGCGEGRFSKFLIEEKRARPFAIDLSRVSVSKAKAKGVNASVGNVLSLPFKDNFSDLTLCIGVLHHSPSASKGFKELVRVTKKGGKIIIAIYRKGTWYDFVYNACAPLRYFRKNKAVMSLSYVFFWCFMKIFKKITCRKDSSNKLIKAQFHDMLMTPVATFHSKKRGVRMGRKPQIKRVPAFREHIWPCFSVLLHKERRMIHFDNAKNSA